MKKKYAKAPANKISMYYDHISKTWKHIPKAEYGTDLNEPHASATEGGDSSGQGGNGQSGKGFSNAQAWGQAGAASGEALGGYLTKYATRDDGSVNERDYIAAKHWEYGAKGAQMGQSFGPWGMLIGGIAGHLYGTAKGHDDAKKINNQVKNDKIDEQNYNNEVAAQQEAYRKQQQDQYTKAYYTSNSATGNTGASIYGMGGKLCKYPLGGDIGGYPPKRTTDASGFPIDKNGRRLTQEEMLGYNRPGYSYGNSTFDRQYTENNGRFRPLSILDAGGYGVKPNTNNNLTVTQNPNESFEDAYFRTYGRPLNPPNTTGIVTKAYGGTLPKYGNGGYANAPGGKLLGMNSDTVKAVGDTHQEDSNEDGVNGITLQANGKPIAEVEDQEIIKGTKVYSDRLDFSKGVTYAKESERLSKEKGKFEKDMKSSDNRARNTAQRSIQNLDTKLAELWEHQENQKKVLGISDAPNTHGYGSAIESASNLVPYADNIYNAYLINKTPKIPRPIDDKIVYANAMPLKTEYNINPALSDVNDQYREYLKNIDQNTANSGDARANKLAAFSTMIKNKSNLYGEKENIETQLKNASVKNIQDVNNANANNFQNVSNTNVGKMNQYNWHNMERINDMNQLKSANVSNAVEDTRTMTQDSNAKKTDEERIMVDSLRYNDGAGMARLVGSNTMNNLIRSNPTYYKQIEKALTESGQKEALASFYQNYGRK